MNTIHCLLWSFLTLNRYCTSNQITFTVSYVNGTFVRENKT